MSVHTHALATWRTGKNRKARKNAFQRKKNRVVRNVIWNKEKFNEESEPGDKEEKKALPPNIDNGVVS